MFPPTQPPQWSNYTPTPPPTAQQGAVPTPAPFFPHQGVSGPRFPAERPGTQSRQALSNMLRQRHPTGAQFVPGQVAPASGAPSNVSAAVSGGPGGAPNPGGPGVGAMGGVARGAGAVGQPPFTNMPMPDKQRQQQFMRQQMRQPHATGTNMFGQQGQPQQQQQQQQQPQPTPQQQQVPPQMAQGGGFPNMHAPMNQNFNMFQGGNQPVMHVPNQQQQAQPQPQAQLPQQQGIMGQHFNQGIFFLRFFSFSFRIFFNTLSYLYRRKFPDATTVAAASATSSRTWYEQSQCSSLYANWNYANQHRTTTKSVCSWSYES